MKLEMKTITDGDSTTIALKGELNTLTSPELKAVLDEEVPKTTSMVLDFAECDFVSSAGLRVLVNAFKEMEAQSGSITMDNIGPNFAEVLSITGLDTVFGCK